MHKILYAQLLCRQLGRYKSKFLAISSITCRMMHEQTTFIMT